MSDGYEDSLKGLRVLLAEDQDDVREIMVFQLELTGATVTAVPNGKVLLERIKDSSFDIILMDIRMPVMDGLTATRMLRAGGCRLPVIAVTAHEQKRVCLEAGFNDYISKPVELGDYVRTIKKLLVGPSGA
jgi:two-component system, sensor histidine kinase and response regulator